MTRRHIELIEHALGDVSCKRNHYITCLGHDDQRMLDELVHAGFMSRCSAPDWAGGDLLYGVTESGKKLAFKGGENQ